MLLSLLRATRMTRLLAACSTRTSSCRITVSARSRRSTRRTLRYDADGTRFSVDYEPGESTTAMFGGNSNWRGPVWMPINYLLIEALYEFEEFYDPDHASSAPRDRAASSPFLPSPKS